MSELEGSYRTKFSVSSCDQCVSPRLGVELGCWGLGKRRPKPADLCPSAPPPSGHVSQNTSAFIYLCVGLYLLLCGKGSSLPKKKFDK